MTRRFAVFVAFSLLLSGIAFAGPPESGNAEAAAAIRAADMQWAKDFSAKNLEKSVGICLDSASVLTPNEPRATGRDAIRKVFEGFFALPDLSISWTPSEVGVAASGELGYSTGDYRMSFKDPKGNTLSDHGKYVTIWKKGKDGAWMVKLDAFNSDLPLPATP